MRSFAPTAPLTGCLLASLAILSIAVPVPPQPMAGITLPALMQAEKPSDVPVTATPIVNGESARESVPAPPKADTQQPGEVATDKTEATTAADKTEVKVDEAPKCEGGDCDKAKADAPAQPAAPPTALSSIATTTPESIETKVTEAVASQAAVDAAVKAGDVVALEGKPSIGGPYPVDFVVTWFNSNDQKAMDLRNERLKHVNRDDLPEGVTDAKRQNDAGELRYNLRGMHQFSDSFVRNIIIVLADDMELPEWLDLSAPKLRIVRHSQMFSSSSALPTFNSHSIESRLHHIPGLAEHFVYFNDDTFLNLPVKRETFFASDGTAKAWVGPMASETKTDSHNTAVRNTLQVLGEVRRWPAGHNVGHHIKPLTISMMKRAEDKYGELMRATESHPFRHKRDISPIFLSIAQCVEDGICAQATQPKAYFQNIDGQVGPTQAMQQVDVENPVMFCLNESTGDLVDELQALLNNHFPQKAPYEK